MTTTPPPPPGLRARLQPWALPAALGLAWALLYLRLHLAGARPGSSAGLPVRADVYYGVAAACALPVCVALSALFARVVIPAARLGSGAGPERLRALHPALARSFALPLLALLVLPEHLAMTVLGPLALKTTLPVLAPLTLLGLVALPWRLLRRLAPQQGRGRTTGAVLLGLVAAGLPMSVLLR